MKLFSWFDQKNHPQKNKIDKCINNNTMWPTASVDKSKPKIFYPKITTEYSKPVVNMRVKDA